MALTKFDIRQSETRILQDQLNANAKVSADSVLASINNELIVPGRLIAASTPSLVVTVGSGTVVNPNTSKNRALPFINNIPVSFTGGTITFPSGTGTITVSPGTNGSITIGASQFVAILVQLNSAGQLSLVSGVAAGSLGAVVVPTSSSLGLLSLGYIIVQSNGSSVIQNITNAMIYQQIGSPPGSPPFVQNTVVTDSTTTGSAATLTAADITKGTVRLTNASLTSIAGIPAGVSGQFITIENQTGNTFNINNNDSGASSANRIFTGTSSNVAMSNNATFSFVYDATQTKWMLVGGTGSGSGSGSGKNYLSAIVTSQSTTPNTGNGNFELGATTGWSLAHSSLTSNFPITVGTAGNSFSSAGGAHGGSAASGNLSISTVSSGQLAGTYSGSYASSAATTAGDMIISDAFNIDTEDQAKVLAFKVYYKAFSGATNGNFSGTSSNSFGFAIYDVTNAAWIQPAGVWNIVQNSGVGYATGTFQTTSNSTQYQIAFFNANASAGAITMYLDDFSVGPQPSVSAPAATDWVSYAPTWSSTVGGPPAIGNGTIAGMWRRQGDTMQVQIRINSGTTTTYAGTNYTFSIPSGYTIDTTKIDNASASQVLGDALAVISASGNGYQGIVGVVSSTAVLVINTSAVANANWGSANPASWSASTAGQQISLMFDVPIVGWSSNTSMSPDTDTRVIAMRSHGSTTAVSSGATTTIAFPTADYDTSGAFSSNTTFTATVTGKYSVKASVAGTWAGAASNRMSLILNKNGSAYSTMANVFFSNASSGANLQGTDEIALSAGETLTIAVLNNLSQTWTADGSTGNYFTVSRLSGPAVVAASEKVYLQYAGNGGTVLTANVTNIDFSTKTVDSHSAWNGTIFAPPKPGFYIIQGVIRTGTSTLQVGLYKNGSLALNVSMDVSSIFKQFSTSMYLLATDTISLRSDTGATLSNSSTQHWISISSQE